MQYCLLSTKSRVSLLMCILFVGLLWPFSASAFYCENKITHTQYRQGASTNDLEVPVTGNLVIGDSLLFDLGNYFFCTNTDPANYVDIIETRARGVTMNLNSNFDIQTYINDTLQPKSIKEKTEILKLRDRDDHDVPIRVEYKVKNTPGSRQIIKKGQLLGTVTLYRYSIPFAGINNFTWRLVAANDAVLVTGTCQINNGNPLEIDFGSISLNSLVSDVEENQNRQYVYIPYQCDDPLTQSINISFAAQSANFSDDLLVTSNPNLGIQLFQGQDLIKPLELFGTNMINGRGGDGFGFALVKKPNSVVKTGPFSASATVVMSVD